MSDPVKDLGFDPDEDLFDFDEVASGFYGSADEEDLEEIFVAFERAQQEELEAAEAAAATGGEEGENRAYDPLPGAAPTPSAFAEPEPALPTPAPAAPEPEATLEAFRADAAGSALPSAPDPSLVAPAPAPTPVAPAPVAPAPAPAASAPAPPPEASEPVAPLPAARQRLATLLRGSPWILVAVTCLNGLVAFVALARSGGSDSGVPKDMEVYRPQTSAYEPAPLRSPDRADEPPLAPASPERHPTFALAIEEIHRGEYAAARRRIYGLLSIVDRLGTDDREEIEARAHFLLAEALHLESLDRMGPDRVGRSRR